MVTEAAETPLSLATDHLFVTSREICDQLHVTYRRLDYWCRAGVIHARAQRAGTGFPRSFSESELRVVQFVRSLSDLGATTDVLRTAAAHLRAHPEWESEVLVSRTGQVGPRVPGVTFGSACWVVNLDLSAVAA